jgi:hypothetical protein
MRLSGVFVYYILKLYYILNLLEKTSFVFNKCIVDWKTKLIFFWVHYIVHIIDITVLILYYFRLVI